MTDWYNMVRGVGAGIASGQERGYRNALIEQGVADESLSRNLIADYTMPGADPESRQTALNSLLSVNPAQAQNVLSVEAMQRDSEIQQQMMDAQTAMGQAAYIMGSERPATALALIDDDETVRAMAREQGFDVDSDEDAIEIARLIDAQARMLVGQGDSDRSTAAIKEMEAFGYPLTPEGFEEYNQARADSGMTALEGIQAQLAIMQIEERLASDRMSREQSERDDRENRAAVQQSIIRNIEQNEAAVDLTKRLEGTMLQSGVPMTEWRRGLASVRSFIESSMGRDTSELDSQIADYDSQVKTLADQVNARIASGQYGTSATQLEAIQRSLANPSISPQAIVRIQGQLAQADLDRADAMELTVPNRDEIEAKIKEWKEYTPSSRISEREIRRMSVDEIRAVDVDSLSPEQLTIFEQRVDELSR